MTPSGAGSPTPPRSASPAPPRSAEGMAAATAAGAYACFGVSATHSAGGRLMCCFSGVAVCVGVWLWAWLCRVYWDEEVHLFAGLACVNSAAHAASCSHRSSSASYVCLIRHTLTYRHTLTCLCVILCLPVQMGSSCSGFLLLPWTHCPPCCLLERLGCATSVGCCWICCAAAPGANALAPASLGCWTGLLRWPFHRLYLHQLPSVVASIAYSFHPPVVCAPLHLQATRAL